MDELKSVRFREKRQATWMELEDLVVRIEKSGLKSLSANELSRLPLLYRSTLSSLSVARSISLDKSLLEYLENLSSRAYFCVYGARRNPADVIIEFFTIQLPQAVREMRWHLLLSGALLTLGGVIGMAMTMDNPENFYNFVSEAMAQGRGPDASTESLRAVLFDDGGGSGGDLAVFSSFLMTHNSKVGMMCFSLSVALGIPTVYLLVYNGMGLGAFAALYEQRELSLEFWSWILPHGVTELLAVVLCGAAGFYVAEAIIFPGQQTRLENVARRGKRAGLVVLGAIMMFVLAGLIEGIFRQTVQDITIRYSVATATAVFWIIYFGWLGRGRSPTSTLDAPPQPGGS
jgi:uncharacterized membrane protein SpoIIM required for sporulation